MAIFKNFIPEPGQTDVARTTIVKFAIEDEYGTTQLDSLGVSIDNIYAIYEGSFINGYSGGIFESSDGYLIGIYPKKPFLNIASEITIHIQIMDGSELDAYNYSFYTSGYHPVSPILPLIDQVSNRACNRTMPFFPPTNLGLILAVDAGIGTEINLTWNTAYPFVDRDIIFYNVYYATIKDTVFDGYPDFLVTATKATIWGLSPGKDRYFGVRVAEFQPNTFTYFGMQQAGPDMFFYPEIVRTDGYVYDNTNIISVTSTSGFPNYGIIQIDAELIKYNSIQVFPPAFIVSERGYFDTTPMAHIINSKVMLYFGQEDSNTIIAQSNPTFQKPNYALTNVLGDGYGPDGYRDGYDGYAYHDGYLRYKQEIIDSITSPGNQNDASGAFPRFDYCGTWRTMSPQSFMQGQCRSSYFGGVQVRTDGYGNRHLVKASNVQTHVLQREEMLLESSGEPFVLIRRMWTGMRCHCFMLRREHPDSRCPTCFHPDTLINTKNGFVKIKDIKNGELVLTDDGSYQKVYNVIERDFVGDIIKIETHTSTPILVTPEHPFLTMCDNHYILRPCSPKCDCFIKNGDVASRHVEPKLLLSGNWLARVTDNYGNKISFGTFKEKQDAIMMIDAFYKINVLPKHRMDWRNAGQLTEENWLENKWSNDIYDIDELQIPEKYTKQTVLGSKRNGIEKFKIDDEFLWICGMYLAEGSSGTRHICFSLHKNENEFQKKIINFFEKMGFNSTVRNCSENGVNIEVHSTTLSEWFPDLFGKHCYEKQIPQILINLPDKKIEALIQGIYDGDGNKKVNEIWQSSKILALQIIELLHRLGKQPLLRFQQSNFLTQCSNKRKLCYIVSWEEETLIHQNRKNRWNFKTELLTKVKKTSKKFYSGKVYNLEVENKHTYVVENIVVHNCFGTGFVQGYVQFFNPRRSDRRILVRVDPATDDLSIIDRGGFEPVYEPDAWTLPFPQIKDRDVVVRFIEDTLEEWRYEVLNVTRNKVLFTQTGAQKFKLKRMPKDDEIYQFPIIRNTAPIPVTMQTSINSTPGIVAHSHGIIVPQGASLLTLKVATLESQGHNHIIYNGIVQSVLNHTHIIV
jgi:intein/homing endonuclease